jgi:hypothetical protein
MKNVSAKPKGWRDNFFGKSRTLAMNVVKRRVILHYHLFKNAGSSIDHLLAANFGGRWATVEGTQPWSILGADALADFVRQRPRLMAVSSHTARLPLPQLLNTIFYPIIFLRHPIDRVSSIYHFERKQAGHYFSAATAQKHDFAGYVERMLDNPENEGVVLRNFHIACLSRGGANLTDLRQVKVNSLRLTEACDLLSNLPVFGLVEHFDQSIQRLGKWLQVPFPGINLFPAHINAQQNRESFVDKRLAEIERALGSALFQKLLDANEYDLQLYRYACELFDCHLRGE